MCVTPETPVWVNARGILSEKMRDQEGVFFVSPLLWLYKNLGFRPIGGLLADKNAQIGKNNFF